MPDIANVFHRLWRPRSGLFWLALGFNVLASALAGFLQLTDPPIGVRLGVSALALTNALLGWWLTVRLWRESGSN